MKSTHRLPCHSPKPFRTRIAHSDSTHPRDPRHLRIICSCSLGASKRLRSKRRTADGADGADKENFMGSFSSLWWGTGRAFPIAPSADSERRTGRRSGSFVPTRKNTTPRGITRITVSRETGAGITSISISGGFMLAKTLRIHDKSTRWPDAAPPQRDRCVPGRLRVS